MRKYLNKIIKKEKHIIKKKKKKIDCTDSTNTEEIGK